MNKAVNRVMVAGIALLVSSATHGQALKRDISSVVAAGKVNGDVYLNTYFAAPVDRVVRLGEDDVDIGDRQELVLRANLVTTIISE
jgi:hypothetical protein